MILTGELIPPDRSGPLVVGTTHPLRNTLTKPLTVPAGTSIAEIVDIVLANDPTGSAKSALRVYIGEDIVPRDRWHLVRPKPGTVVLLRATLQGPNTLRNVLLIAIAVAGLLVPGLLGLTGIVGAIVGAGITIGGALLVNMLFPVIQETPLDDSGDERKTLLGLNSAQNEIRKWGSIPVLFGTHRITPPLGALPYTEARGNDQYLHALFVWSYGAIDLQTDTIAIGETGIGNFEDVTLRHRDGSAVSDNDITGFPQRVTQQDLDIAITNDGGGQVRTTEADTDRFILDFEASDGMGVYNKKTGAFDGVEVLIRIAYKREGENDSSYVVAGTLVYFRRSKDPQRKSFTLDVPRGKWTIEVFRLTEDFDDTDDLQYVANTRWTAIKSVNYGAPVTFPIGLAMTTLAVRATDQFNGQLDSFRATASARYSSKVFDGSSWQTMRVSRNPANAFRYVLQGRPNARPVPDSMIDEDSLERWWQICEDNERSFDYVLDQSMPVYELLKMVAAAGRAMPSFIGGKWGVAIDDPDAPVVWHFTPRNSWGFSAKRVYRNLPHALRARFINAKHSYSEDEIRIYRDGYNRANSTLFESVEFPGITSSSQVWKQGRYLLAQAELRPETYTWSADFEALILQRGDRVYHQHDVLLHGLYSGRVKSKDTPTQTIVVDETILMEVGKSYQMRFRRADGDTLLRTVVNTANETNTIELAGVDDLPAAGDLFSFGEIGSETSVMRIMSVEPSDKESAKITAVDDAPGIYDADSGSIPDYDPGISLPPDPFEMAPTSLRASEVIIGQGIDAKSRVRLTWLVPRLGNILSFQVQARDLDEDGDWTTIAVISNPHTQAYISDLEPGDWNFRVRSLFADRQSSSAVTSGAITVVGLLQPPPDVENFVILPLGDMTTLQWDAVVAVNLSHYVIRFSPAIDGSATWGAASPLILSTQSRSIQVPTRSGSYLIKAVTYQEQESVNATIAITSIEGAILNAVEILNEDPGFAGLKDDTEVDAGALVLEFESAVMSTWVPLSSVLSLSLGNGYVTEGLYYFATSVDLGEVYTSRVSASVDASGESIADTIQFWSSLDVVEAIDNSDPSDWSVEIQLRRTDDDPAGSPVTWSDWETLVVGDYTARGFEFRAILRGTPTVSPRITNLEVTVDMPDRHIIERDMVIPVGGRRFDFDPPFKALKGITFGHQDMATGDRAAITNKDETGFDIRFFNSVGGAVQRTTDYDAVGYGKVLS